MEFLPVIVMAIMISLIAALLLKIRLMRKSIREIIGAFHERLAADTNALIGISSLAVPFARSGYLSVR